MRNIQEFEQQSTEQVPVRPNIKNLLEFAKNKNRGEERMLFQGQDELNDERNGTYQQEEHRKKIERQGLAILTPKEIINNGRSKAQVKTSYKEKQLLQLIRKDPKSRYSPDHCDVRSNQYLNQNFIQQNVKIFQSQKKGSIDTIGAQRAFQHSIFDPLNPHSLNNRPQLSFDKTSSITPSKTQFNINKKGFGLGGGKIGSSLQSPVESLKNGRRANESPHERAEKDKFILQSYQNSPQKRVNFLRQKVREMRYNDYTSKVLMLNKVKDYFKEHWKKMGVKKKKKIIGIIKRMEGEIDIIENEVT